jgi:hypothetical protein
MCDPRSGPAAQIFIVFLAARFVLGTARINAVIRQYFARAELAVMAIMALN